MNVIANAITEIMFRFSADGSFKSCEYLKTYVAGRV